MDLHVNCAHTFRTSWSDVQSLASLLVHSRRLLQYPHFTPAEHEPVRHMPAPQLMLEHVLHLYPLPTHMEHDPVRYWLDGHLMLLHVRHRYEFWLAATLHDPVRYLV